MTGNGRMQVQKSNPPRSAGLVICVALVSLYLGAGALLLQAQTSGVPLCRYPENAPSTLGQGPVVSQATEVGDTKLFWAYAQGFFTGYYTLSATCQQITDHAYLIAEDAYLNDLVVSSQNANTLYAAANGGVFKSTDGGLNWAVASAGLPTFDGTFDSFDSTGNNYNLRCDMHALFSRAEYGQSFDTVWVGTEFGPFWSTTSGDTFVSRSQGMAQKLVDTTFVNDKPAVYDILGHPTLNKSLWSATVDGVYMTRNANKWKRLSDGLPPSEGTSWQSVKSTALQYSDTLLFVSTDKGIFYGSYRPLIPSDLSNSEIVVSWKPLGGQVTLDTLSVSSDTIKFRIGDSTSTGLALSAGQNITVVDPTTNLYWFCLVDESLEGLTAILSDSGIFYYPSGTTPPPVDYSQLNLDNLVAYGYSQIAGQTLLVEKSADTTQVWLGTTTGIVSYHLVGTIFSGYTLSSEAIMASHDSLSIYKIAKKDGLYYFATPQGLFSAGNPHGSWTRLTGYVSNSNDTYQELVDTRTIVFGPQNYAFTGGHLGGFLRSIDRVNFTLSNRGMMHRLGTDEQLTLFATEFEFHTPADANVGIFQSMQDWWGNLSLTPSSLDIDGDPRVYLLFLDIEDWYHFADAPDPTPITGYFEGINEYSLLYFAHSNQHEMFYLDTEPQWINRAGGAACGQMFNLINWNQDPTEEIWLREGLATFSQYQAGYPVSLVTSTITFPTQNDLTAWGDQLMDKEHLYSFLLLQYLHEQLLPDDTLGGQTTHPIAQVASSPYHGVAGLGRLIFDLETGGPSTDGVDYTQYFGSFFNDFVLAGALDCTDSTLASGQYGFSELNVKMIATTYNWYWPLVNPTSLTPFAWNVRFWGARASQVTSAPLFNPAYPITQLAVNGDDRNRTHFTFLFSKSGRFIPNLPADSLVVVPVDSALFPVTWVDFDTLKQKGYADFPDSLELGTPEAIATVLRLITVCTSDSGSADAYYVMHDDSIPPEYLHVAVSQNPVESRYLDVYSFTQEQIFPDGGRLQQVISGLVELEGPKVDVTGGIASATGNDTLITLDQNVFYSNSGASDYIYHIAYYLDKINFPANLNFKAYAEDAAGNEIIDSTAVNVAYIQSSVGGTLSDPATAASLYVPPLALSDDEYVILSVSPLPPTVSQGLIAKTHFASLYDDSHYPVGPVVSAGSAGIALDLPIDLRLPYDANLAANSEIGVYRAEGGGWIYIGGVEDYQAGLLRANSLKFGQFQVFAGPLGDMQPEIPYSFKLEQNYPNPFNPSTRIQFELTRSQRVTVEIYNILGSRVVQLADASFPAGRHHLSWSAAGLSSGVYFLRLHAEEGTLYRKMMILK